MILPSCACVLRLDMEAGRRPLLTKSARKSMKELGGLPTWPSGFLFLRRDIVFALPSGFAAGKRWLYVSGMAVSPSASSTSSGSWMLSFWISA